MTKIINTKVKNEYVFARRNKMVQAIGDIIFYSVEKFSNFSMRIKCYFIKLLNKMYYTKPLKQILWSKINLKMHDSEMLTT